jgi:hypothetical protein
MWGQLRLGYVRQGDALTTGRLTSFVDLPGLAVVRILVSAGFNLSSLLCAVLHAQGQMRPRASRADILSYIVRTIIGVQPQQFIFFDKCR